jgi:hypothetical protein
MKQTIYFQSSFEIKYNEEINSYGMFATEFIPKHSLILVECGLSGSCEYLSSLVSNNDIYKPFVNQLYPRDKDSDIKSKLIYNCFGNTVDEWRLYFTISKINHNCIPNAGCVSSYWIPEILKAGYVIGYVVSYNNIEKGEEITIQYSLQAGHGCTFHNWKCECNNSIKEKKFYEMNNLTKAFMSAKRSNLECIDSIYESVKKDYNIQFNLLKEP